jgi:hypothetical protein
VSSGKKAIETSLRLVLNGRKNGRRSCAGIILMPSLKWPSHFLQWAPTFPKWTCRKNLSYWCFPDSYSQATTSQYKTRTGHRFKQVCELLEGLVKTLSCRLETKFTTEGCKITWNYVQHLFTYKTITDEIWDSLIYEPCCYWRTCIWPIRSSWIHRHGRSVDGTQTHLKSRILDYPSFRLSRDKSTKF